MLEARGNLTKAHLSQLPLELAVVKWCGQGNPPSPRLRKDKGKKQPTAEELKEFSTKSDTVVPKKNLNGDQQETWREILACAKGKNMTIEALLRAAELLEFDGKVLQLGVHYQFHKERLETGKNRELLDGVIQQVCGPVKVVLTLTQPSMAVAAVLTEPDEKDIIQAAEEIFGE